MAPVVMAVNDDLPIRTDKPIHNGKVRAVYPTEQHEASDDVPMPSLPTLNQIQVKCSDPSQVLGQTRVTHTHTQH